MDRRKIFPIAVLIILSLLLFVACSNDETPSTSVAPQGEASQTEQSENHTEEESKEEPKDDEETEQSPTHIDEKAESENATSNEAENTENTEDTEKTEEMSETSQNTVEESNEDKVVLEISGTGIDNPLKLSLDKIKEMKDYYFEDDYFSLNSFGTKEYFSFKGIKLKGILEKAKLKEDAAAIKFVASDGYSIELTIEQALKEDYIDEQDSSKKYPVIIAWNENGEDYNAEKGLPFRLVIGQKEPGDVNKPQWVQNIAKIIVD